MVLDAAATKEFKSFDFISQTASALFSFDKQQNRVLNKSIRNSEELIEALVGLLENIDKKEDEFSEEKVDSHLQAFTLGYQLTKPLVNTISNMLNESDDIHSSLYKKQTILFHNVEEINEILEKIVMKLQEIKEVKLSDNISNISIQQLDDLWRKEEEDDLNKLFNQI